MSHCLKLSRTPKYIVPPPAFCELLVRARIDLSQRVVEELDKTSAFRVDDFNLLCAI